MGKRRSAYRLSLMVAAALGPLLVSARVAAQGGTGDAVPVKAGGQAPTVADGTGAQDIIVTARKFSERLQSTPIAVTAVSAKDLAARSATDISAIVSIAPSVQVTTGSSGGNNNAQFYIRGVGQADYLPTADPAVGVYVDGVYIARTSGNLFDLADIDQVEVLRGPQGTLFGKNTSGGAISVTTHRPTGNEGGHAELTGGSFGRIDAKVTAEAPIVADQLAGSLSLVSRHDNGFGKRLIDGKGMGNTNMQAARAALNYYGDSRFSFYLTGDYTRRRERPRGSHLEAVYPSSIGRSYQHLVIDKTNPGDALDGRYTTDDPNDSWDGTFTRSTLDVGGVSGIATLDLGGAQLKSTTAWRAQKAITNVDNDGTPYAAADYYRTIHQNQASEELQLSGAALADRLKYVLGAFYLRENARISIDQVSLAGFYQAQLALGVPVASAVDPGAAARVHQTNDSWAGYGNLILKVTDRLGISAGVRYSIETKAIDETGYELSRGYSIYRSAANPALLLPGDTVIAAKRTFRSATPTVGIQYQATRAVFLYATYAQGFKSGGFDGRPIAGLTSPSSFDPEKVKSYEAGAKLDLFGRLMRLNLAVYHVNYDDLQVTTVVPSGAIAVNVIKNAGKAKIDGVEAEWELHPVHGMDLGLSASYTHARFTEVAASAPFSIADHLVNTPKWILNPYAQYRVPVGEKTSLLGRIDVSYRSRVYFEVPNGYQYNAAHTAITSPGPILFPTYQNGYGLVDARLTYSRGAWDLSVFGTNLTDVRYKTYGFSSAQAGLSVTYYGPPREYGASVGVRF